MPRACATIADPMKPSVLVTKRIFQQAIDHLKQHADVEYVETDDGLPAEELMRRIQGKQGIVSQLTDPSISWQSP